METAVNDKGAKVNSNIEINQDLIVKCFDGEKPRHFQYKIVSVVNHIGPSYSEGHYTTTVRHEDTTYTLDDSNVTAGFGISGQDAYLLFYECTGEIFIEESDEWIPNEKSADENKRTPIETNSDEPGWIEIDIVDENEELADNKFTEDGVISDNQDMQNKQDSSRRIVDIEHVFSQIQNAFNVSCKKCNGEMVFSKETRRGLNSKFRFTCSSCYRIKNIDSCPKVNSQANNNEAAVNGIISIGLGYYHLQEFLIHFNIPCMSYQTFYNVEKRLQADWWALSKKLEAEALDEEKMLAKGHNEIDSAGNALIGVKVDGSWPTRAYNKNFKSLAGCAAIVGIRTNKVLYSHVKNKYCHTCKIAESKNSPPNLHQCNANWTGPSTGMENAIIVEGFKHCAEKSARFHKFVGDGDSSTYKALRDLRLYQNPTVYIDKYDCVTHVHKNFYKKMAALENNKKFNPNTRKLIGCKVALDIGLGVRMAAKHWNECDISLGEKCRNLEKDCMNAPLHCLGVHDECSKYFCTKTTTPEARDRIALLKSDGLYYEILSLCQHYFANKAKSLLAGLDNNVVEGFNSIICKLLGGKRVNNCLAGSYKSRTAMASVHLNSGYRGGSTFQQFKYGNILPGMSKMENTRKRKVQHKIVLSNIFLSNIILSNFMLSNIFLSNVIAVFTIEQNDIGQKDIGQNDIGQKDIGQNELGQKDIRQNDIGLNEIGP
ncbi:hypothetical protein HA402_007672 [Bradysia odoriphaga]|nr:hypothetical protein HA402_007672 [Bradysia odoriphaga]